MDNFVITNRTIATTTNLDTAKQIKERGEFIMIKKHFKLKLNIRKILNISLVTLACTMSSNSFSGL